MEMHETRPKQQVYRPRFKRCASCIQFKLCVFMGIKFYNHIIFSDSLLKSLWFTMAACKFHYSVLVTGTVVTYMLRVILHRQKVYI
jgi:uncharacterized membrane protein